MSTQDYAKLKVAKSFNKIQVDWFREEMPLKDVHFDLRNMICK